jgi:hypothetical protein
MSQGWPDMNESLSLSRMRASGVALTAGETVAIVQQLITSGDRETDHGSDVMPLDHILITEDGHVIGRAGADVRSIPAIGRLLEQLLPVGGRQGVSGGLRYVIARALGEVEAPPFQSLEELARALVRFESGDRVATVRDVFARAAGRACSDFVDNPFTGLERRRASPASDELRRLLRDADRELFERRSEPFERRCEPMTPPAQAASGTAPPPVIAEGLSRQTTWLGAAGGALAALLCVGLGWLGLHVSRNARPAVDATLPFRSAAMLPGSAAQAATSGRTAGAAPSQGGASPEVPSLPASHRSTDGERGLRGARPEPLYPASTSLSATPAIIEVVGSPFERRPWRALLFSVGPGIHASAIGIDDRILLADLEECAGELWVGRVKPHTDSIFLGVGANDRISPTRLVTLKEALRPGGTLWIIHRLNHPLGREGITAVGRQAGLRYVNAIMISPDKLAQQFLKVERG